MGRCTLLRALAQPAFSQAAYFFYDTGARPYVLFGAFGAFTILAQS